MSRTYDSATTRSIFSADAARAATEAARAQRAADSAQAVETWADRVFPEHLATVQQVAGQGNRSYRVFVSTYEQAGVLAQRFRSCGFSAQVGGYNGSNGNRHVQIDW